MKKIVIALVILALAAPAFAVSPNVRIAQIYTGGGSSSTTAIYKQDYVVLFNASGADVNISGWTLEYGSATGNWGSSSTNLFTFPGTQGPAGTPGTWIKGCSYLMVACSPLGTPTPGGADFPVVPDFSILTMGLGASAGKLGLFSAVNSNLACGSEVPGTLVDKISWGSAANCAETAAVIFPTGTNAANRNGGGTIDTDSNVADFTTTTTPVPFNSMTPSLPCAPVTTENQTFGTLKAIFR